MKITALTHCVLVPFSKVVDVSLLSDVDVNEVEHCAYCACMCFSSFDRRWAHFSFLVSKYVGINLPKCLLEKEGCFYV